MKSLILLLKQLAYVSTDLEIRLEELLEYVEFPKDHKILKTGQVCHHITFIESGLVRIFYWKDIEEVTTWLLKENDIFIAPQSFLGQEPSHEDIVALEPCRGWRITYQQLNELCCLYPEFLWHYTRIMGDYYLRHLRMNSNMVRQSSLEKYANLIENDPELLLRVPAKYLYSYLDMSKASFERARDEYARKKGRA